MSDHTVPAFISGVYNLPDAENIPKDAASSSLNWLTRDGKIKLVTGRALLGAQGAVGSNKGLDAGYKTDGSQVLWQKINTKIQYYNGTSWVDVITGLTSTAEYTFLNYSSLAGTFTFALGIDGIYKMHNAFPANYISLYDATKNFKFKTGIIDKGRLIAVRADKDFTGLYGSRIDAQDATVYTTVTGESIGAASSITYTGTLAFKGGGANRNAFGITISALLSAGTETFTDNYLGVLTGSLGGTGTINYVTGAYSVTFSNVTIGPVTATYQYEDSNIKGITDFTKSATRLAAEGFVFRQDEGGDAILSIQVGLDGAYYSLKSNSAYRLKISDDDVTADNNIFRRDIGIPNFRAAVSSGKGIFFMNTADPQKPELTILTQNPLGGNVEAVAIFPQFDFSAYNYSECVMGTYDKFILISCKSENSSVNDITLMCEFIGGKGVLNTVNPVSYGAKTFIKSGSNLYAGGSATETVYQLFTGIDDDGSTIDNHWVGKAEKYGVNNLKKFKKIRIKGSIVPDQSYDIYADYDGAGFQYIDSISGRGSYVDYSSPQTIGSNLLGEGVIGGDSTITTYPYFTELKIRTPKFRTRTIKIIATGIGYCDVQMLNDWNIFLYEERLPKRFRQKPASTLPIIPEIESQLWDEEGDLWDEEDSSWDEE